MFRKIEERDRDIFIKFCDEFYSSDAVLHKLSVATIERTFNEVISSDRYLEAFIIEHDGKACGYGLLSKSFSPEVGGICIWLEELYIRKESRDKGLGSEFLEYIEDNYTFARLRLEIEESNQKAQSLYERYGYKVLGYRQMHKDID